MTTTTPEPVDHCLELANAAGVKSTDEILLINFPQRFKDLKKFSSSVRSVSTNAELKKLLVEGYKFNKVFIGYGNILEAAQLVADGGRLGHLNSADVDPSAEPRQFREVIDYNFLNANVWQMKLTDGSLDLTNACGLALTHTRGRL